MKKQHRGNLLILQTPYYPMQKELIFSILFKKIKKIKQKENMT